MKITNYIDVTMSIECFQCGIKLSVDTLYEPNMTCETLIDEVARQRWGTKIDGENILPVCSQCDKELRKVKG